jgi:aminopeptidase N
VRRAVVGALGRWKTPDAAQALTAFAKKDASYLVEAEAARGLGKTRQASAVDTLIDLLERESWADVIRVAALEGLGASRDERVIPHLVARTRYGHSPRTRRAATLALPKVAQDRKVREVLEELLDDKDAALRLDVARALADLGDSKSAGALRARLEVETDARAKRRMREALRDLTQETKRGPTVSRDDFDKLESEHGELKARLAAVEARLTHETRSTTSKPLPEPPAAEKPQAKKGAPAPAPKKKGKKG